ncbi:MAG TPA: DUF488 domain-containing protein [Rhodanobacter sp.]|nr:DUF488 domain-containing protein [Rhodanobacter sp.]
MSIAIKRVYEPAAKSDGYRVLIDRLWPRGLKKEAVPLDVWAKELAPSTELRKWFGHDPALWSGFQERYVAELDQLKEHWQPIAERATTRPVTILFGAHDTEHNNAVVMKAYLEKWLHAHGGK